MWSWGEDSRGGFWSKEGADASDAGEAGIHHLKLGYHIQDLSVGHNVLAFIKTNGNAFIIRTHESKDGRRVKGKQKFIKCKEKIQEVSCEDDVVTLMTDRGSLICVDSARPPFTPRPLEVFSNIPVCQVASGSRHSLALTKDGQVYAWGQDTRGQLGLGKNKPGANSPQHLRSLSAIPLVQIAAGGDQSFALSVSGGVFSWGRNDLGQLGLGDTTDRHTPTPVNCLNMKKTVHISCGKDHTAILTKHGAVFTFGSGQHGQLGHNSFRDEHRPRLVAELLGARVTKISCGRHHTLVMTDSEKIYSFGCGEQGQLGHGDESHPSVPLPVQLPQDCSDRPKIKNIFAGGNCSFATFASNEEQLKSDGVVNGSRNCLDDMIDKWTTQCDFKSWKKIKQEIHWSFSSASYVNKSFLEQRKDKHFQTSAKYSGLNLSTARLAFKKLVMKEDVLAEVEASVMKLLQSFYEKPAGVEGLRIFLLLNELLYMIQKRKPKQNTKLAEAVAAAVLSLPPESLQVIGQWWSSLSASAMVKYIKVWKQALTANLSLVPVPRNSGVKNLLLVLQYMYNANSRTAESQRMPESDFCLAIDPQFLVEDLNYWIWSKSKKFGPEPLIICKFPIVMDLQTKKMAFDSHAEYTKKITMGPFWWNYYMAFGINQLMPQELFLELDLERASIAEGTFEQLGAVDHTDYKRPLAVFFDENIMFDNVHIKDLFHEVFYQLVTTDSGMFVFNDSETLAWFPSQTTQEPNRYFLFGVLCGLALYNQCIIHLPFPMALFKKLLGVKPSLDDMMEFSPSVAQSLLSILKEYNDDDIENLYQDFTINWAGTEVDLDPENPEKMLTGQNKKEFVDAYVNYAFNASVENVFHEFKRGFFQVCERELVRQFRPEELQEVLVGRNFTDWEKLKQNTEYEGYHVNHPTIKMFWEVFDELNEDQKKTFLWFVTGFERVPVLGTENIKMKIRVKQVLDLCNDQYYPESHTCFCFLDLPSYSTKDIMQTKLTEALSNRRINK